MTKLEADQLVRHQVHGEGFVVADLGPTVLARFGTAIHQVERESISLQRSLETALLAGQMDDSRAVLCRAQALAIASVNDKQEKSEGRWPFLHTCNQRSQDIVLVFLL